MTTDSMQDVSSVLLKFLNAPRRRYTIDEYMDPLKELGVDDETLYATVRQLRRDGLVEESGADGYYIELTNAGAEAASAKTGAEALIASIDQHGKNPSVTMSTKASTLGTGIAQFQAELEELRRGKIETEPELETAQKALEHIKDACAAYITQHAPSDIAKLLTPIIKHENRYRTIGEHPFRQRAAALQGRIDERIGTLAHVLALVGISDPIQEGRSLAEERSDLTAEAKASLLLEKLYALRKIDGYHPTKLIFALNQVALDGYDDARGVVEFLKRREYVKVMGTSEGLDAKISTEGRLFYEQQMKAPPASKPPGHVDKTQVFIVHGHDEAAKYEVARFIERLDLHPIILHEQASSGKTIIEKIEEYTNVGFGIVLYTECDLGAKKGEEDRLRFRARQNVVFEHGFLIGKIGRKNVCALVKGDVETPGDITGVVYVSMQSDWKLALAKELRNSGYEVDMNKVI